MLGRFITIEGIDGAGKSTQTESLLKHLADQGVSVLHTREPGGTPLAEKIRAMLLADEMAPDAETLLFFAARADHVRRVIRPTLESGRWVLSDRFTDATYAYQVGGKGFSGEKVEALENWTLGGFAPDLTLLFDIAPAVAAARLRAGPEIRIDSSVWEKPSSPACGRLIWQEQLQLRSASSSSMRIGRQRMCQQTFLRGFRHGFSALSVARGARTDASGDA